MLWALSRPRAPAALHGRVHGAVQSLWALSLGDEARDLFGQSLASATMYDVAACCTLLLDSEWRRSAFSAYDLWLLLHGAIRYPPLRVLFLGGLLSGPPLAVPGRRAHLSLVKFHREEYLKLARLVQHLHLVVAVPATPDAVLGAMVEFSQNEGRWLKVASGTKAACLEGTAIWSAQCAASGAVGGLLAECGAFVGYSAVVVARRLSRVRLLSCELDPVHVAIARFVAALALPGADIGFRVGRASDLLPAIVEDSGACAVSFLFMDHSNAHFHEELLMLQRLAAASAKAQVLADNVLKPGAPLYLWMASRCPEAEVDTTWAMSEFRHEDQEDWMATTGAASPSKPLRARFLTPHMFGDIGHLGDAAENDPFTWRWSWGVRQVHA
mmetsp:Transcript_5362/g.10629  ORF Transcript_5362/g.10629 Transcript_5362/m.10629 type:complete len:384 (+) Transcript_5362:1-1152(+)